MKLHPLFRPILSSALLLASSNLQASSAITLTQAIEKTLQVNVSLMAYPFDIRQQQALHKQAKLSPQPTLFITADDVSGTNNYQNFRNTELTLTLSQTFEMGDKRKHRLAQSEAKEDLLTLEYHLAKTDISAETTRRYYEVLRLQSLIQLNAIKIEREKSTLKKIKALTKIGIADPVDLAKMALTIKQSQSQSNRLKHQHTLSIMQLTAMWQAKTNPKKVLGNLKNLPGLPLKKEVQSALDDAPEILIYLALQRQADQTLQLETSQNIRDITLSAGFRHKETDASQTLNLGFSIPLNFSNPNQGRVAAAKVNLEKNLMLYPRLKQALEMKFNQYWLSLKQTLQELEDLNANVMPGAENLIETTEQSYQRGNSSLLQTLDAQQTWIQLQEQQIAIKIRYLQTLLELERLVGKSLNTKF